MDDSLCANYSTEINYADLENKFSNNIDKICRPKLARAKVQVLIERPLIML